jgi:hypothetical protein
MLDETPPWANDPIIAPAQADNFTGVIPGSPKPKEPSIPSGYEPDPEHPGAIRPMKGGPNDPSAGDVGTSDLTGDAYLSTLDKPTGAMVKALAEGRKSFPSGAALKAPYWQNMLAHVSNYDPGFDETNYTSRSATRKDFSIGTAGKNIRALNTAIGHLGQLYGQIGDTASHEFSVAGIPIPGATLANAAENAYLTSAGRPGPKTYASTTSALSGELTAVYRGAGGAEADIQRYINELSPNASEAQKKATIKNIAGLLNSRLEALQDQYQKGMGVGGKDYQFLDDKAQSVLGAINGGPPGAPPSPGGGGDGPPGTSSLSPDQQSREQQFRATNPTAEQYAAFLSGILNKQVTTESAAARLKAAASGAAYNPGVVDKTEQEKVAATIAAEDKLGLKENPSETLLKHGATLNLSDEAAGIGNAAANVITSPFTGKFDPVGSYQVGRDVERQRITDAENQMGGAGSALEFVGGMASGNPTSALSSLGLNQLVTQGAKGGAAAGTLAGYGSGEGTSQSLGGAVVGGAGGAAVGALAPYAAGKFAERGMPKGMAPDVAQAAEKEGVDLIRPMVDPASRGKFGALESAPGSQNVIRAGIDNTKGQIADRVAGLGQGGTPIETDAAGGTVQNAARRFIQRSKGVADTLYNRARSLAGDTRFVPQNAIDSVDQSIQALSANGNTNAGEIKFLEGLKEDLATSGGKTIEELRQLRQSLRGRISEQNLGKTQAEARAIDAMDATQKDAAANLPNGAATAYRRADTFYRERQVHTDDILDRFLGGNVQQGQARLSGEEAFKRLKSMMTPGGDARRLAGLMRDLEPSERQDISATIAASLGRRAPDEPFQLDAFLRHTNALSPQARRTVFGADGAQSIENLRLLTQRLKDAGGDINRSRTANSMWRQMASGFVGSLTGIGGSVGMLEGGGLAGSGMGAAAGLLTGTAVKGAQLARRVLSARAMVNPRLSKWLADAATVSTPSQAKQAVKGLSLVISREPALAHELTPIRDFLDQRVTQLLAAEPDDQKNQ